MSDPSPQPWLRAARWCGALPLLVAALAMAGFFVAEYATFTSLQPWTDVGVAIILLGLLLVVVGLALLAVHAAKATRSGLAGHIVLRQVAWTLALFFANFPLALLCVLVAGRSIDDVRMRFVNESAVAVEDLEITWPGGSHQLGTLAPGQSHRFTFDPSRDGVVRYTARQGGQDCAGELLGYVHSSMSLTSDVVFDGGCQVRLVER
ncbi:MAG: hypothetical protein VYE77_10905 [Planctomycetota bacterium]|nr:hypothetical protein [Planctomycetota bacterium]